MDRTRTVAGPSSVYWQNREAQCSEVDWRRKAAALQKRRWHIIRQMAAVDGDGS